MAIQDLPLPGEALRHIARRMEPRRQIDAAGAFWLVALSLLLGLNQVAIKFTNEGLQPVFWAGLRSALAAVFVFAWLKFQGKSVRFELGILGAGSAAGLAFSIEFLALFVALDLTTVVRTSVLLYSMPVWLAIAAHFLIPGERLTRMKTAGLALAVSGVAVAMFGKNSPGMNADFLGDLCALAAAIAWACIPLCTRQTKFSTVEPEMQLMWMVAVSAPVLAASSLFFGPVVRDFQMVHVPALLFQAAAVVTGGFMLWLHMLRSYPANSVASFSFLAPVFGVFFGWLLLGESVGAELLAALVLVSAGIVLINRPASGKA